MTSNVIHREMRWGPLTCGWLVRLALVLAACAMAAGCAQANVQATARKYTFWPQFPDEPHIQFLTSFSVSGDVIGRRSNFDAMLYGRDADADFMIDKPYGVAMHDGKIYVCDTRKLTLTILDLRKKEVRLLGATGLGKLLKPIAVAVAPDGMIYVADTQAGGVFMYGADEQYIGTIKHAGLHPVSLAVDQKELYVANMMAGCVEVYDRQTCKMVRTISKVGRNEGEVSLPLGVALDKEGNMYVDDMINCRVQRFAPDGKLSMAIGGLGDHAGTFARPKHLAVDGDGIIYVVDAMFQNVQMFNAKGQELMFFGGAGSHPGAMDLPAGICVDDGDLDLFQQYVHPAFQAERLILVTNQFGDQKVSVYALGHLKPGKTVADLAAGRTLISTSAPTDNGPGAGGALDAPPEAGPPTAPSAAPATQPATTAPRG